MPKIDLFDRTTNLLQKVMDLRMQRQDLISTNIANAETPGYKAARLEFEENLSQALSRKTLTNKPTHPGHIPVESNRLETVQGRVVRERSIGIGGDGNGVRVDQEMITMAENQILYEAATQMIRKKLGLLKYVSQDGK